MKKGSRLNKIKQIIEVIIFLSLVIPAIFLIFKIVVTPNEFTNPNVRVRSDYVLMLLQCLLGIAAMLLPGILSKKLKITIPSNMYFLFVIFLYCAIFLGEISKFYYNVAHWDTILHTFSGAMLGALGFSIISIINKKRVFDICLSPFFIAFFAFCFAVTVGVFWEIYEFSFDSLFGLNMQKFALESGKLLVGQAALVDTMKDLIVDCIGALVMAIIGYIGLKNKRKWYDNLLIKFNKNE